MKTITEKYSFTLSFHLYWKMQIPFKKSKYRFLVQNTNKNRQHVHTKLVCHKLSYDAQISWKNIIFSVSSTEFLWL